MPDRRVIETAPPQAAAEKISALEVTGIQHSMRLSDLQLSDMLGFARSAGLRRLGRWKDGSDIPSGPAAKMLRLLYRLDAAMRVFDRGDAVRAMEMVREALPEELQ